MNTAWIVDKGVMSHILVQSRYYLNKTYYNITC